MKAKKQEVIKWMKIEYNGTIYENIVGINRCYDYSSFRYLDSNGNEVYVSFEGNNSFKIITENESTK